MYLSNVKFVNEKNTRRIRKRHGETEEYRNYKLSIAREAKNLKHKRIQLAKVATKFCQKSTNHQQTL